MCTLSWQHRKDGYSLWFNRDELHTRAPELAPVEQRDADGAWWLAPTDPDSGGTWLMANTHGVTAALLNGYAAGWRPPSGRSRESRGRLVPLTTGADSVAAALAAVEGVDLAATPPFALVFLDAAGDVARVRWDGRFRRVTKGEGVTPPQTSSSFDGDEVARRREAGFPRSADEAALTAYHHSHDTAAGAYSVNMSRDDASTRSICRIRVRPEWVLCDYEPQNWPGAPRTDDRPRHLRLPRTVVSAF